MMQTPQCESKFSPRNPVVKWLWPNSYNLGEQQSERSSLEKQLVEATGGSSWGLRWKKLRRYNFSNDSNESLGRIRGSMGGI